MTVKERDPYLCAAGSFFFPGLGQVYCGRILRGIVFLIPAVLLTLPYPLSFYAGSISWWVLGWAPFAQIVDFIVRVIATYDAYKVARLTKTD